MTTNIIIAPALRWSGALRRRLTADPAMADWLTDTAARPLTRRLIPTWMAELRQTPTDIPMAPDEVRQVLRQLRARVFYTALVRDITQAAPLQEVVAAMSALADLAVAEAYRSVAAVLAETHGTPMDPVTGRPQEMLILGMGKLGGRELNVSSDIDLVMLYGEEGETQGRRRLSHHEFYGRLTQRMMPVLSEIDAQGQVFRTDLRLRPDGDAGPLAWSLDALEHYLVAQGREWERYAWLKARALPCRAFTNSDPSAQWEQLETLRRPFVYRKYFDFDALAALRTLRERIREDWHRRALARHGVDAVHNIKLGDGGIREVEFVIQLNQLVRGGRQPSLQQRGLLPALHRQRRAGVLSPELADALESAYVFLRQVEHRLQYREDEQTHLLPADDTQRALLAETFDLDLAGFDSRLAEHRAIVHQAFRDAFRLAGMGEAADTQRPRAPQHGTADPHEHTHASTPSLTLDDPEGQVVQRMQALQSSHRLRSLSRTSRQRVEILLPAILHAASAMPHPRQTAVRLLDLIEHIAQRSAYLALLAEYPEILARVARLVGSSAWASSYLCRYPLLLDGLIEWHSLMAAPDFDAILRQLQAELDASLLPDGRPDIEQQMNLMRDLQHQITFQLLAQDLAGVLSVEQLADQLSALADLMLGEALRRIWPMVRSDDSQEQPRFAIIAYGKLGGKELGYASDLDLVFLYDDPDTQAGEDYLRLSRRLVSWLSTMTSSGRLYDIDLRLRPDGDAGLLAVPIDAFTHYQRSNAWTWEHQAISRARYVAGDTSIGERFESIRREVLLQPRDTEVLKTEVRNMRAKIIAGHPNRSGEFDLKHDRGGMVDVEFSTQFLVLTQSVQHPELLANLGNIALLGLAGQAGLLPPDLAGRAANAYRVMRRHQHALRLEGAEKARLPQGALQDERAAVQQLWMHVIG